LLSSDGNIYAFGRNEFGELGNQKKENELSPQRIKIETKFIDISSRWFYNGGISIALSQDGIYFIWGKCGEEIIQTPKPTDFESFVEIYAKYFKVTGKTINFEEQNSVPPLLRQKENIFKTQIILEEENGEKVKVDKTECDDVKLEYFQTDFGNFFFASNFGKWEIVPNMAASPNAKVPFLPEVDIEIKMISAKFHYPDVF
jgi:hypothetical protein